ncbi:MAG TPA: hypothetical protein VF607_11070, partial [Verrucomicrobiae bacterium]
MKYLFTLAFAVMLAASAGANEIIRGTTLTDGQQLYASDLHNLVDTATIGVQFYNDAQTVGTLASGYYFLVLDPANQVYRRVTAQTVLYGNTNFWINTSVRSLPAYGAFLFFDPTNGVLGTVTASNLLTLQATNIYANTLRYFTTNNAGATNNSVFSLWPNPVFSGFSTNYPFYFFGMDTNGAPYRVPLLTVETGMAADIGTNLGIPYRFTQAFRPWALYGTNAVTNAWGLYTNFPITSMTFSNAVNSNGLTVAAGDTIPIFSTGQGTNTTITVGALQNSLGIYSPFITNGGVWNLKASGYTNIFAVTNTTGAKLLGVVTFSENDNNGKSD